MAGHHLLPGRLTNLRERLRSSFWFVPSLFVLFALVLATISVAVDEHVLGDRRPWFLLGRDAPSARDLVSTIASSTFTFIGVVFSITVLVLQLTSSQYSSRVLRTFLQDRTTQLSLGTFAGTLVFAIRVLPSIQQASAGKPERVPAISTTTSFALVIVSVLVFLVYLDHMAQSIRVVSILRRVSREGMRSVRHRYPIAEWRDEEPSPPPPAGPPDRTVTNDHRPGVVTHLEERALVELARARGVVIEVVPMIGEYVPLESPTFRIWGSNAPGPDELRSLLALGLERTPEQDALFSIRELVDIAERAISPSINDPTTAVQALDAIHDLLRSLVRRPFTPPVRRDAQGAVRLFMRQPDWSLFVRVALTELRQYGTGSVQVARRIHAMLDDLISIAPEPRRAILEEELRLLDQSIDRGFHTDTEKRHARGDTPDERGPW